MADKETIKPPADGDAPATALPAEEVEPTAADEPAAQAAVEDNPDNRLVKISRQGDEPANCITYEDGSGSQRAWHPVQDQSEFEVKAIIADAAVASGFFVVSRETKTRLKRA